MGLHYTGYGQQTALFAPRIKALGHDVAISAFYGLNGSILHWEGMNLYPAGYDLYGNDVVLQHAAHHFGGRFQDGLIITLVDVFVFNAEHVGQAHVAAWCPVDHDPAPARVVEFFERSGATPIAMSRFGERMLRDRGLDPLYVPHGFDGNVYRPIDKVQARESMGFPQDKFIIGMVSANKGWPARKGFTQAVEAFARFHETHPDSMLYLHTESSGVIQGVNLPTLLRAHDIPPDAVRFPDPYRYLVGFEQEMMASVYSSFDVLLNPAYGEGFGVPIIEAQACGVPVITTDWTAMPELTRTGEVVSGARWWSEQESFQKVPSVPAIVKALNNAYDARKNGTTTPRRVIRERVMEYEASAVAENYWRPALEILEARCAPLELPEAEQVAA